MILRIIPYILILLIGCRTASNSAQMKSNAEDNKDVVVLSHLIRDYMSKMRSTSFTLEDIVKSDTLRLITKSFSKLEVGDWSNVWSGGYAVYFKFADGRNKDSVKLMQYERIFGNVKTKKEIGKTEAQFAKEFDGEIHFSYPEKLYHITEIILKESLH